MNNKASVLLVDDDTGMTETLSDILEDVGHYVEVANDGFKAIERIKARVFDLVLMDIKMPGINGVKTYKEIKCIQPEAAVMMMTAYSVDDLVAEALKEGVYGVLHKPIDVAKVIEFIEYVKGSALLLIVDNDMATCETIRDLLEEKRYRIAKASSGEDAIKMVKKRHYDLVFIDITLPIMNGLETYLTLKKIRPVIKVIMMTAYRQEVQELVEEAIDNNAYACLYKPFDVDNMLKLVKAILANKAKAEISQMEVK